MSTSCAIHAWIVPLRSRPILSKIRGHLHDGARFTVLGKPLVMWSQMIHEIRPPQAASSYFRVKLGTVRMPEVSFSRHRHAAKGLLIMGSGWRRAGAYKLKTFRVGRKRNQRNIPCPIRSRIAHRGKEVDMDLNYARFLRAAPVRS